MMTSEIRAQIDVMFEQLAAEGYAGHQDRARHLIAQCRASLLRRTGQLGPWEAQQLDAAESAVSANFLRLGLVAAQKALAVSQLPVEEYEYGVDRLAHRAMTTAVRDPAMDNYGVTTLGDTPLR
jgi:hypothetical protein